MPALKPGDLYLTPRGQRAMKAPKLPERALAGTQPRLGGVCREFGVTAYFAEKGPDCTVP